jgi:Family of unknown function (DUF6152)
MQLKLAVVTVVLIAVAPIWAHHGSTGFDQNRPVHFVGKVSQVEWVNPHVVVHIDATGADGKVATWLVNTIPPNTAKRLGFSQNSFAIGIDLTIDGFQALDGSNHVNGTSLVFKDGQKITSPDCFAPNDHYCFRPVDSK